MFLPFQQSLHRFKTNGLKYRFPPIHPVMSHQGLGYTSSPYSTLPFRISIEILDNRIYIARIVRQLGHRLRPVEQSVEFLILWALSYHYGSRCCSFIVPVASLNLITPDIRLIDQPGVNNKVSAPLGNVRKKRPVLLRVDGQSPSYA